MCEDSYAQLNHKLGVARKKALCSEDACSLYYSCTIAIQPDLVDAHYNLGVALQQRYGVLRGNRELLTGNREIPIIKIRGFVPGRIFSCAMRLEKNIFISFHK